MIKNPNPQPFFFSLNAIKERPAKIPARKPYKFLSRLTPLIFSLLLKIMSTTTEKTTINIQLRKKEAQNLNKFAKRQGFSSNSQLILYALKMITGIEFVEFPKLSTEEIVNRMQKTGKYKDKFLNELKAGLEYADKIY